MRRAAVLAFFAAGPVLAQSSRGDVAVTIYNDNLALVQDTRQLNIPARRSRQEFPDVSAQIRAETVSFAPPDTAIVEQNFDYDLLSRKLMEKAVGKTVTIVRVNPATGLETREQAMVLATNGGVVLQIGARIEVLLDDGLPVRVIFDRVPENLRARPTLSVTLAKQPRRFSAMSSIASMATVATGPCARRDATIPAAMSICERTRPPKMWPFELMSPGRGTTRTMIRPGALSSRPPGRRPGELR